MADAAETDGGPVPAAMRRLDLAVCDLEAIVAGLAPAATGEPASATEAAAEVARLRALHQAVAGRLDRAIERLRRMVDE
jgi:hypothetical protein